MKKRILLFLSGLGAVILLTVLGIYLTGCSNRIGEFSSYPPPKDPLRPVYLGTNSVGDVYCVSEGGGQEITIEDFGAPSDSTVTMPLIIVKNDP